FLSALRWIAFLEGISAVFLFFIAMPLKYYAGQPLAVEISGAIHGGLFSVLVLMLILAVKLVPISFTLCCAGVLSAIVPFGPFVFDLWLKEKETVGSVSSDQEE
ncbi:MAG: DUF3817 domain-containing protein, partial [Planctomycetota bacterium]